MYNRTLVLTLGNTYRWYLGTGSNLGARQPYIPSMTSNSSIFTELQAFQVEYRTQPKSDGAM